MPQLVSLLLLVSNIYGCMHNINLPLHQCIIHGVFLAYTRTRYTFEFRIFYFIFRAPECTMTFMLSGREKKWKWRKRWATHTSKETHFVPLWQYWMVRVRRTLLPFLVIFLHSFLSSFRSFVRFRSLISFFCSLHFAPFHVLFISHSPMENDIYLFIFKCPNEWKREKNHFY